MTPLKTPNLELDFENSVAAMTVTGKMQRDTLTESFEWLDELSAQSDEFTLCVEMKADNFDDLAEASKGFRQVADVLRRVPTVNRCALLTDSTWLRNSAKVESAVLPGLSLMTFAPDQRENAKKWLNGETLIEEAPKEEPLKEVTLKEPSVKMQADTPARKTIETKTPAPKTDTATAKSKNPWDNLNLDKVDI